MLPALPEDVLQQGQRGAARGDNAHADAAAGVHDLPQGAQEQELALQPHDYYPWS